MARPEALSVDYWALAQVDGGWRLELAGLERADFDALVRSLCPAAAEAGTDLLSYVDEAGGAARFAVSRGDELLAAFFFARTPVQVSRQWACGLLTKPVEAAVDRYRILAGRPSADRPECGAVVCSCFQVGVNQILEAAKKGATTVAAIGETLQAGTNCGSCRSEINGLLNDVSAKGADHADIAKAG